MLYPFLKTVFRALLWFLWRWKVEGLENIPASGPVVVVSNHVSLWDPIAVACALPRQVNFMAKEELFQYPLMGNILNRLGAFPVKRGQTDRTAIRRALEILENNQVLGLFPEGTRSRTGELQKPQPGAAMIALKARAAVVPVACIGTVGLWKKIFKPGALVIKISPPKYYEEFCEQKLSAKCLETVSQDMMNQVALMMEADNTTKDA